MDHRKTFLKNNDSCHRWLIFATASLSMMLDIGFMFSFGTLYVDIMTTFSASRSEAAIVQSVLMAVRFGTGLISGTIVQRFGTQTAGVFGSLLAATGLVLSYFATSILILDISIGVILAFGSSCLYIASSISIGQHFLGEKRHILLSIQSAAGGIGGMIYPFVLKYLSDNFGLKGALLIVGGIYLQLLPATILWRDKRHNVRYKTRKHVDIRPNTDGKIKATSAFGKMDIRPNTDGTIKATSTFGKMDIRSNTDGKIKATSTFGKFDIRSNTDGKIKATSTFGEFDIRPNTDDKIKKFDIRSNTDDKTKATSTFGSQCETKSNDAVICKDTTVVIKVDHECCEETPEVDLKGNELVYIESCYETIKQLDEREILNSCNITDKRTESVGKSLKQLACDPTFVLFAVGLAIAYPALGILFIFIVDLFLDAGLTSEDATFGLLLVHMFSIFGRLLPGLVMQSKRVPALVVPMCASVITSAAMAGLVTVPGLKLHLLLLGIIGIPYGVFVSVFSVTSLKIVGIDRLSSAIGIHFTLNGVGSALAGPISGLLRDGTGSYAYPFWIASGVILIGGMMFTCAFQLSRKKTHEVTERSPLLGNGKH